LKLRGKVHNYGANVDTDAIIPARYLNVSEPRELAQHCMEDIDSEFLTKLAPGDIIMADTNFGCGSSREHAPVAIRAAGISCVIAKSFARIFFRNAINIGLPVIEIGGHEIETGHQIEVDLERGWVKDLTANRRYPISKMPAVMVDILNSGGLVNYLLENGDYILADPH